MFRNKKIVLLLLVLCLLVCACTKEGKEESENSFVISTPEEKKYTTSEVTRGTFCVEFETTLPRVYESESIVWKGTEARVVEVMKAAGESVKKGEVLLKVDAGYSDAERTQLQLRLESELEDFLDGKGERLEEIRDARAALIGLEKEDLEIAQLQLENMELAYEQYVYQTERTIQVLRDQLNAIEEKRAQQVIKASIDGIIEEIYYSVDDTVRYGDVLAQIYSTERFFLSEEGIGFGRYGMKMNIAEGGTWENIGTYTGEVICADNILSPFLKSGKSYIKIDQNVDGSEFEYATMASLIYRIVEDAIIIDSSYIVSEDGEKDYVYVLENGEYRKQYVQIGGRDRNNINIWIVEGLSEGQIIAKEEGG
ncbi:MAG: hypothetical protein IJ315_09205 [Firmicutes bacterium]|nr:hypothetical protein [Bacillota bacterium]